MSFISLGYLALIPLAAVPVIIHMIFRQKYRVHEFSTLLFFTRSRKFNVFRRQLRHVFLMCLRISIVLLALFAFARLSISGIGFGERHQAVAVIVDGSYSMTRRLGEDTLFATAKRQVELSIRELPGSALIGLVSNEPEPKVVVEPTSDREKVMSALAAQSPFYRRGSSWAAVNLAERTLVGIRTCTKRVVVLTDLQRSDWLSGVADGGMGSGEGRRKDEGSGSRRVGQVPVEFLAYQTPGLGNCALVDVLSPDGPVLVGRPVSFTAIVRNTGEKPVDGLQITAVRDPGNATAGGGPGEMVRTDVPALGTVQATFFFTFGLPGSQAIGFRISDDTLASDNEWTETVRVGDVVPVLCLNEPGEEENPRKGDAFYLSLALSPGGRSGAVSPVMARPTQLSKTGLYGYGCVFLPAVLGLGEDGISILQRYVHGGGGLVVFCGAGTDESALRLLLGMGEDAGKCPIEVEGRTDRPARIAHADFSRSSVGTSVRSLASQLHGVSCLVRQRLSIRQGSPAEPEVLARFDDGSPAIVEFRYGYGRCVVFAGGCGPPETDLPFRAVFPTLVQELARRLAQPVRRCASTVRPGGTFLASFEDADRPEAMQVNPPGNSVQPISLHPMTQGFFSEYNDTGVPGLYGVSARYGADEAQTPLAAFAVNVGGEDSDLRPAAADAVRQRCAPGMVSVTTIAEPSLRAGLLATTRRDLTNLVLVVVLLLVVSENLVSWLTK